MDSLVSWVKDLKNAKIAKNELIASTVRMPSKLHSFIDDLAEQLSITRQDFLFNLIEKGVAVVENELGLNVPDELQENCTFYLLNTNKRNDVDAHENMLKEGIAAAFYAPWKHNIDRIKSGDFVCLYESGLGIVAYGEGTGITLHKDYDDEPDECHYQKLNNFHVLETPISANEIKKILNKNIMFIKTMSSISDGQKLLDRMRPVQKKK